MFLDKETFRTVVRSAPLISIDLIVLNSQGQVLLGEITDPRRVTLVCSRRTHPER